MFACRLSEHFYFPPVKFLVYFSQVWIKFMKRWHDIYFTPAH